MYLSFFLLGVIQKRRKYMKFNFSSFFCFLVISFFLSSVTGCAIASSSRQPKVIGGGEMQVASGYSQNDLDGESSEGLRFDDIPIPSGFKLDLKESFVFKNDLTRVGIIKYVGKGNINSVTSFYKKQMPLFNWETINSIEFFKSILSFTKETQTCVVIIEQFGARKVMFTIASGPKNKKIV
jgi:hypothetical protein